MADTYTKIADLIDPEVMGDMVSARIPKKTARGALCQGG